MKRVTVDNIGSIPVSESKKHYRRYYKEMMIKIGTMPAGLDGVSNYTNRQEKRLSPERFSTNYKTREEFEDDRTKILEYLGRMEYAPEDLVQKVSETVKELDLQFGE